MNKLIAIFAVLAFAVTASANGPRAVQFRGGGQQFRNQSFRQPALNALRFAGNLALRGHGFAFRQGFNGFSQFRQFNQFHGGQQFRQNFYGSAFRQSYFSQRYIQPFYAQQYVQPIHAQPIYAQQYVQPIQQFAAPCPQQYTQGFADPCGGAAYTQPFAQGYSQPFAAYSQPYSAYGLGFNSGYGLPFRGGHGHGGHHHHLRPAPVPVPVPTPGPGQGR